MLPPAITSLCLYLKFYQYQHTGLLEAFTQRQLKTADLTNSQAKLNILLGTYLQLSRSNVMVSVQSVQ